MTDSKNCLNIGSFCLNYFIDLYLGPYIFVIPYSFTIFPYPQNPKYVSSVSRSFFCFLHIWVYCAHSDKLVLKTENILLITEREK